MDSSLVVGLVHYLPSAGIVLEQLVIGFSPTVKVTSLGILQSILYPVLFKLLDGIINPIRILLIHPLLVYSLGMVFDTLKVFSTHYGFFSSLGQNQRTCR